MSPFYYIPIFFQGLVLHLLESSHSGTGNLLLVFSHSILPLEKGSGTGFSDYFIGPYFFAAMIISLIAKRKYLNKFPLVFLGTL